MSGLEHVTWYLVIRCPGRAFYLSFSGRFEDAECSTKTLAPTYHIMLCHNLENYNLEAFRILSMLINGVKVYCIAGDHVINIMIYSCQLPQRAYITLKHVCISDDNVVNVQCHFPPPISTGLPVCSFVCGVNHHYQTRSDTHQQYKLHYILCSILLDQNYFHMA